MADKTYVQELEDKLIATKTRLKQGREMENLKASAPTLFEIIDGEISLAVNKMTQAQPVPYDEYLSLHGQVVGIRRIRNLIDAKEVQAGQAAQEVQSIQDNLEQIKNDQVQN